jgi:hypothetical protein
MKLQQIVDMLRFNISECIDWSPYRTPNLFNYVNCWNTFSLSLCIFTYYVWCIRCIHILKYIHILAFQYHPMVLDFRGIGQYNLSIFIYNMYIYIYIYTYWYIFKSSFCVYNYIYNYLYIHMHYMMMLINIHLLIIMSHMTNANF